NHEGQPKKPLSEVKRSVDNAIECEIGAELLLVKVEFLDAEFLGVECVVLRHNRVNALSMGQCFQLFNVGQCMGFRSGEQIRQKLQDGFWRAGHAFFQYESGVRIKSEQLSPFSA